jgi:hypothetical protein
MDPVGNGNNLLPVLWLLLHYKKHGEGERKN